MREKYESLALKDLKELAKIRGIKGISSMTKAQLVDAMLQKDEETAQATGDDAVTPAASSKKPVAVKEKAALKKPDKISEKADLKKPDKVIGKTDDVTKDNAVTKPKSSVKTVDAESKASYTEVTKINTVKTKEASPKTSKENIKSNRTKNSNEPLTNKDIVPSKNKVSEVSKANNSPVVNKHPKKKSADIENGASSNEGAKIIPKENTQAVSTGVPQKTNIQPASKEDSLKSSAGFAEGTLKEVPTKTSSENFQPTSKEVSAQANRETAIPPKADEAEKTLDSGIKAHGILEIMPDGYGFIRCENFLPGENDVYVAPSQIRRFGLKTGDIIDGSTRIKTQNEKFSALLYLSSVNGYSPDIIPKRVNFEDMTPIFPDNRINLETPGSTVAMRVMDLLSPVGRGQRGMIVSPPKAGKTTLLKEVAKSVKKNHPDIHMIILLIDERPEEVTDIKEAIEGPNVEVIYSTFDELPEHHKRVSEMVIERAKRLVEHHKDVMILLDSITRLTRAYNLTVPPSGRTLSGGLDPAALHMPKRFFGAARNMREGGSLTILATALVETGSKMDDVVYEEFKGTGNMEMVLDRKLSEKRIFPAIDIAKSGTRRDDLLLSKVELDAVNSLRKAINGLKPDESVDRILDMFSKTRSNNDFINMLNKIHIF